MIDTFDGEHRFLSNFYPCTVEYAGEFYRTVEHAYQAAKTCDPNWRTVIRYANTPTQAKRLGRRVSLRQDWEGVKEDVMLTLLRRKFANPAMREKLLATGDEELVEGNWWGDTYWGVCKGKGENRLGILLMQVRGELQ